MRPLVSGLRMLGHDPAPSLRSVGIEERQLDNPDAPISMHAVIGFMDHASRTTGDANIGLHLAEHAELDSVDIHAYAMLASATLGDAYRRMARYHRLLHPTMRIEVEIDGPAGIVRQVMPGGVGSPRHLAEFLVAGWVRCGRVVTGRNWKPDRALFAHASPPETGEHRRFFGAPVEFSMGQNALVLPVALLEAPCVRSDAGLARILDRYATERLARTPREGSVADHVRNALAEALDGGEIGASAIASRLKMSVRTLHRALADEGTAFGDILTTLRKEIAIRQLADPRVSSAEVAFRLGFSELSAFQRAFKRWTSQTPAKFRAAHRRQQA